MARRQDRPSPYVLVDKPSTSFSSVSSAASATSAGTSRSGGSRLLFGEIDLSSDRASESYASVCSFVLCDSGTFLKFWLEDRCRDTFLSYLSKDDLASLRLACHDFSVRAAPKLFSDLSITFKTSTFTRPARIAALDRLGFHVKELRFNLPHSQQAFLPPLVEPDTGEELSFTYTPQIQPPTQGCPKYGDIGTTEILTRQWPALFHAATNVPAFIRAFSAFINLEHLHIGCPGYDPTSSRRRSVADFTLISLRIAVERNRLNALNTLTLSPLPLSALAYLSPALGFGCSPRSLKAWSGIRNVNLAISTPSGPAEIAGTAQFKLLQNYLRVFQGNLETLKIKWVGGRGPWPLQSPLQRDAQPQSPVERGHSEEQIGGLKAQKAPLQFPHLKRFKMYNVATSAAQISAFASDHKSTIQDMDFDDVKLTCGTWEEASAPLTRTTKHQTRFADIPIMLSPTAASPVSPSLSAAMERVEHATAYGRPSLRVSKWFSSRRSKPIAARKVREGIQECEEQVKRVLGGVLAWR